MAIFKFELIKLGYKNKEIKMVAAINEIIFEDDDEIVTIPSEYNGMPITHVGYRQGIIEAHVRFHDWHHPSQGYGEYVEDEYVLERGYYIYFPSTLKKLIFPKTVKVICTNIFNYNSNHVTFELEPGLDDYMIIDGKIV